MLRSCAAVRSCRLALFAIGSNELPLLIQGTENVFRSAFKKTGFRCEVLNAPPYRRVRKNRGAAGLSMNIDINRIYVRWFS